MSIEVVKLSMSRIILRIWMQMDKVGICVIRRSLLGEMRGKQLSREDEVLLDLIEEAHRFYHGVKSVVDKSRGELDYIN